MLLSFQLFFVVGAGANSGRLSEYTRNERGECTEAEPLWILCTYFQHSTYAIVV